MTAVAHTIAVTVPRVPGLALVLAMLALGVALWPRRRS